MIKISEKNEQQIVDALAAVNGRAHEHTYTTYAEIAEVVSDTEAKLADLRIPKKYWRDAQARACSGEKMPNSYRWSRTGTSIKILRRVTGWYLTDISSKSLYPGEGGIYRLLLTPVQDEIAVKYLRLGYSVQPAKWVEVL